MKIGLFSIGLDTYWGQYEGLLPRLQRYEDEIAVRLQGMQVEVVRGGMVDNVSKSHAAASLFLQQEVVSAQYLSDHQDDLASCPADIVKYHQGQVNAYVSLALSQNALELLKMSSLFPKVGDNDLSMEIIRAYDACELLQTDINRHYSNRSASAGDRVPWLRLNDMEEYTVDIKTAIDAIDTFLMK